MELSELERKTLILLANHGPLTGYDLSSKKDTDRTGKKASTNIMSDVHWLKIRKKLVKNKLIKEFPEEGRRKPYILDEDGFDIVLRECINKVDDFEIYALYYTEYFPLVLSYWNELKNNRLDSFVKRMLTDVVDEIYLDVVKELVLGKRNRYSHKEFIEDLYVRIYLPEMFIDGDNVPDNIPIYRIRQFRNGTPQIKNFINEWISEEKNNTYKHIQKLEQVEKT
ncbi:hypothetical protein ACFL0D_08890 [Thermoproteota archaeon]